MENKPFNEVENPKDEWKSGQQPIGLVLYRRINNFLSSYPLGAAGRVLTYDSGINCLVLCMHTTSPEKTEEATARLFEALPEDIKGDLKKYNIGFEGRQI